jgi:hypothetical protein
VSSSSCGLWRSELVFAPVVTSIAGSSHTLWCVRTPPDSPSSLFVFDYGPSVLPVARTLPSRHITDCSIQCRISVGTRTSIPGPFILACPRIVRVSALPRYPPYIARLIPRGLGGATVCANGDGLDPKRIPVPGEGAAMNPEGPPKTPQIVEGDVQASSG